MEYWTLADLLLLEITAEQRGSEGGYWGAQTWLCDFVYVLAACRERDSAHISALLEACLDGVKGQLSVCAAPLHPGSS